jgi:peptidoglycan hydrolase CwlO-like protein
VISWNEIFRAHGDHPEKLLAAVVHNAADAICLRLDNLNSMLREKGEELMSELDDLQASVDSLTSAVSDASAELSKLAAEVLALSTGPKIDPAAVEAAAVKIKAQADALNAASAAAEPTT